MDSHQKDNGMDWQPFLEKALKARQNWLNEPHLEAIRLFNGYSEGNPELIIELFARTLLLTTRGDKSADLSPVQTYLLDGMPWVNCVIQKNRGALGQDEKRGKVTFGQNPDKQIEENGIKYAIDLTMNQDASFYMDTRYLRQWLLEHAEGWQVLNTFAYTGSLGIAALAGGARMVIQSDLNARFLAMAQESCLLNRLDSQKMKCHAADFFPEVAQLKRSGQLFDCVIADPPFFSTTTKGTVNLVDQGQRIINKLRPLIRDGGRLISINNALFLSGRETREALDLLCADGYLEVEEIIPVPEDITGFGHTIVNQPPVDPAPYNHSTKITILKVRRKTS